MLRALKRDRLLVCRFYSAKVSQKTCSEAVGKPDSGGTDGIGGADGNKNVDHPKVARERQNFFGIPLISESLERVLFGVSKSGDSRSAPKGQGQLEKALEQLRSFGIRPSDGGSSVPTTTSKLSFELPALFGDVESHFYRIGQNFVDPFLKLINGFVGADLPAIPAKWEFRSGWTRYDPTNGSTSVVPCPLEDVFW